MKILTDRYKPSSSRAPMKRRAFASVAALLALCGIASCANMSKGPVDDSKRLSGFTWTGTYLAARFADASQDADNATVLLSQILAESPDNAMVLQRTLFQSLSAGRFEIAQDAARGLLKLRPNHGLAHLALAVVDLKANRLGDANSHLAAITEGPSTFIAPLMRAWIAQAQGQTDDAIQFLNQAESQGRLVQLSHAHRALILDVAGRTEEAREAYANALKDGGTSLQFVDHYANFLSRTGERDRARDVYEKTIEAVPDYTPAVNLAALGDGAVPARLFANDGSGVAIVLYDIANALKQDSVRELAIIYLRLAYALDPKPPQTALALGDMLIRIGRVEEGLGILETIKSGGPLYMQAQMAIATAEANIGRDEEAELCLSQLATALPASSTPFIALGDHFRERQNYARAVDAYDAAFARIGKPQKRHWLLYFARGAALERLDRWGQAQSDLDLALALNPDEAIVLNYLGYSLLDRKLEPARARRLIEQAASTQPNDGYIIDSLGWAYFRAGEIKRAVEVLERAVQLKPQDSTINDHLGDAYWRADRKLEARFQWTHALNLNPEPEQEKVLRRKLDLGLDLSDKANAALKTPAANSTRP